MFAGLVVVSHSFVLMDGGKVSEPLYRLTHTVSLGDLAVDCFFLISGYLILQSLLGSHSAVEYMGKRALRIYPGYIVACIGSLFLGHLSGGILPRLNVSTVEEGIARVAYLDGVSMSHAFAGVPMQGLNGSLWSIAYEFRCYVLLMFVLAAGIIRRRWLMAALVVILLVWAAWLDGIDQTFSLAALTGTAALNARMFALFGTGCLFYLFKDNIRFTSLNAAVATVPLAVFIRYQHLSIVAIAIFGGYLVFWLALKVRAGTWSQAANRTDLSYGVYLYGWPVTCLIIWWRHTDINRWALSAASLVAAVVIALGSWHFIEKPALGWKRFLRRMPTTSGGPESANHSKFGAEFAGDESAVFTDQ